MEISTTRIQDLQPEPISMSFPMEPIKTRNEPNQMPAPTYQPITDVHRNPYGIEKPTELPNFSAPLNTNRQNAFEQPQYSIPARDIPHNQPSQITIDPHTQTNYIPPPKLTADFIGNYDKANEEQWQEHRKKKHRQSRLDMLFTQLQTPLCVAFLYFMFLIPAFHVFLLKHLFSFMLESDGNLNVYGMAFKSFLFGLTFYGAIKITDYFSEI
jgi:hypothetical protein